MFFVIIMFSFGFMILIIMGIGYVIVICICVWVEGIEVILVKLIEGDLIVCIVELCKCEDDLKCIVVCVNKMVVV